MWSDKIYRHLSRFLFGPSKPTQPPPLPRLPPPTKRPLVGDSLTPPPPPPRQPSAATASQVPQQQPQQPRRADHGTPPNLSPSSKMSYHYPIPQTVPPAQNGSAWPPRPSLPLGVASGNPSPAPPTPRAQGIPGLTLLDSSTNHNNSDNNSSMAQTTKQPPAPTEQAKTAKSAPAPPVKKGKKRKEGKKSAAHGKKGGASKSSVKTDAAKAETHRSPSYSPRLSPRPSAGHNDPREARQVPSLASGGVPDPTPLYLARAFAPPAKLQQPRRILVILDLNGTVLYRPTRRQPTTFVERPHAKRFLAYCLEAFSLAIWSSARPINVSNMLNQLLTPEQRDRCVIAWARDRMGLSPDDYNSRVQCYKRLTAVWGCEKVQASHPAFADGGRWDQSNTVLVDDSPEKGRSEPHNILAVPEFAGLENEAVDVLPQVHDYLNSLCYQADISRYMRQHPFKLDSNYRLPDDASSEPLMREASA